MKIKNNKLNDNLNKVSYNKKNDSKNIKFNYKSPLNASNSKNKHLESSTFIKENFNEIISYKDIDIVFKKLQIPEKIYIEPVSDCNLNCKMCFREQFRDPSGQMSINLFEKIYNEIIEINEAQKSKNSDNYIKTILFGGLGEPLMHPNIVDYVEKFKKANIEIIIQTNGFFLNKYIDKFIELEVNKIIVSSEAGDIGHLGYDYIYNNLKKYIKKVENRKQGKPIFAIESVITRENFKNLGNFAKKFIDIGVNEILLTNIMPVFEEHTRLTLYPSRKNEKIIEDFLKEALGNLHVIVPYFDLKTERVCNFINSKATVIRFDGEVAPCYRFLHDTVEYVMNIKQIINSYSFGNISSNSLIEIYNSKEYLWFRFLVEHSIFPSCPDCNLRDGCSYIENSDTDCWGNVPSCANCLWARNIILCP